MRAFRRVTVENAFDNAGLPQIRVSWALDRSFAQPGPYAFALWRGYGPDDDHPDFIASGGDGHWMYDTALRIQQMGDTVYYRVVLTDADGAEHLSPYVHYTAGWSKRDWRLARKVCQEASLVMRRRSGVRGVLLKRRMWGLPCDTCTDPVTHQCNDPNCVDCYGTRFTDGYHPPVEMWVNFQGKQSVSKLDQNAGHVRESTSALIALAYPTPEPGDVWVDVQRNLRYRVGESVQPTAIHRGTPLVLQVPVQELPKSDSVYRIPLVGVV